uniref:Uncharacterized protein n=1 Tax=Zea mays TaxID=4577 RepID=C4IZ55_MAIZE|nr:unknown [Zea mays]
MTNQPHCQSIALLGLDLPCSDATVFSLCSDSDRPFFKFQTSSNETMSAQSTYILGTCSFVSDCTRNRSTYTSLNGNTGAMNKC